MANIKITSGAAALDIEYRQVVMHKKHIDVERIRRSDICRVQLLLSDKGVILIISSQEYYLKHEMVDEIDADTGITTNLILYNKLKELM